MKSDDMFSADWRSIVKVSLVICAVLFSSGCSTLNGFKLWAPEMFGMERIADHVYSDKKMTESQRKQFIQAVHAAKSRMPKYFGEVVSVPDIFACSTEACFQRLGGMTSRAKAFGASKILMSPRGLSVPLLAHEWSHTELYERLGGYSVIKRVPAWFNEGLAVVVSGEPSHSEKVWAELVDADASRPPLSELLSRKDWLVAVKKYGDEKAAMNPEIPNVVYATAGHEVRKWFEGVGPKGLMNFIAMLKEGTSFKMAYELAIDKDKINIEIERKPLSK